MMVIFELKYLEKKILERIHTILQKYFYCIVQFRTNTIGKITSIVWLFIPFYPQCGKFRIFPSHRFYVKSKLAHLEYQNLPF